MTINSSMDKYIVINSHNEVLFFSDNEQPTATLNNMKKFREVHDVE